MRARSISAIAPRMCICSLPAGVVASMPSPSDTNAMPSACSSSSKHDQVSKVPAEPIEPPDDEHIEPTRITEELVECRPPVLGAADAPIDVLGGRPMARFDVATQLGQLVLRLLVERRHAGIDSGSHISSVPMGVQLRCKLLKPQC